MDALARLCQYLESEGSPEPEVFPEGTRLFQQEGISRLLYIILQGSVALYRKDEDDEAIKVDVLGKGDLMGLLAFLRRNANFTSGVTQEETRMLVFSWEEFERRRSESDDFARLISEIVTDNFIQRYERVVRLSIERSHLNRALELERKALQETISALRETRNRLISQEKLAILGQLVAGLAHELNNPVAAQASASRQAEVIVEDLLRTLPALPHEPDAWFREGLLHAMVNSQEVRKRRQFLRQHFPRLKPAQMERAVQLPESTWRAVTDAWKHSPETIPEWETSLAFYDLAQTLRTIRVAGERIGGLVRSLKQYSRQSQPHPVSLSLQEGIEDTLGIVSNRLKTIQVEKSFDDIGPIEGDPGELNQVWTNLIINACDAMSGMDTRRAVLTIRVKLCDDETVLVEIADTGPGIPDAIREKVFEPSYTTKQAGLQFGLGLGLTISREIIERHGGRLEIATADDGGALFKTFLPRRQNRHWVKPSVGSH